MMPSMPDPLAILAFLNLAPAWADVLPTDALILDDERIVIFRTSITIERLSEIVGQLLDEALEDQALARELGLLSA